MYGHLDYLVTYPFGCLEQTTSGTRPLLFSSQLSRTLNQHLGLKDQALTQKIYKGLERIVSMQTPSGGFGYWPGATNAHLWGTAYATHLLIEAQSMGYVLDQKRIDEALDYLSRRTREGFHGKANNEEAYAHYTLARAGRFDLPVSPLGSRR